MLVALGVPPLSIASQLYQPARPAPICAIHGHTDSGGASIVIACVESKSGAGTSASTGSGRRFSRAVAMQVAPTITLWKEHVLYPHPGLRSCEIGGSCRRSAFRAHPMPKIPHLLRILSPAKTRLPSDDVSIAECALP